MRSLRARTFVARARPAIEDPELCADLRDEIDRAIDEIEALRQKARALSSRIEAIGERMPAVQYLRTIPGIGPLTATALVSFVGEPRHHTAGVIIWPQASARSHLEARQHLPPYAPDARRSLRAPRRHRTDEPDALQLWALRIELRCGHNKGTVALANRLARIAWRICVTCAHTNAGRKTA
jgi:transposase